MGRALSFKSAASVSLVELAAAFTASFAGYFNPMQMTVESLSQRVRLGHLDLQNSLLVDHEGALVGMALLAPDAYALIVARPDGITQVVDLAASPEDYADALVAAIAQRCGALRVVNEPEESLFVAALAAHGFVEVECQHEMSCELS